MDEQSLSHQGELGNPREGVLDAYLRMGLDATRMVLWDLDPETGVIRHSGNVEALIPGDDRSPFCSLEALLDRVHLDDRDRVASALRRCLKTGVPEAFDYRARLADGSWRWLAVRAERVQPRDGSGPRLFGVTVDVSPRKLAEEGLRDSEERFRELAARIDSVLWVADPAISEILYVSPAYERVWRRSCQSLRENPRSFLEAVHPDDRGRVVESVRVGGGKTLDPFEIEYRILWPDGSVRWIRDRGFPIHDAGRRLLRVAGIAEDITAQKQADTALREREEIHSSIIAQAGDGIVLVDGDTGEFVEFNTAAHERLGYTREEFARLTIGDVQAEHSPEVIRRNIETMRREGGLTFETRHRRRDGEIRHVRVSTKALENHGRRYITGVWCDITERIGAEQVLLRRNALLATQQDVSIDGILAVDENFRILSFNRRFAEMWNIPQEFLATRDDMLLLQRVACIVKDPRGFRERVDYLYEHRRETGRDELVLNDGRVFDRYSAPMFGPGDEYYGRVWYFRDITGRKLAEAAVRESEQKYRGIFDESVASILVLDSFKRVADVNQAGLDLLGYSRAELSGMDVAVLAEDAAAVARWLENLAGTGRLANHELRLRGKSGTLITVLTNSRLLLDADGNASGVLATLNDITELKRAEEMRGHLEGQLRQAQKLESIGRLAGGIAHDFNNLLTVINGYSDLAMGRMRPDDPFLQLMGEIRDAGQRAAELTSQLLAFSRRQLVEPKPVNLHELMQSSRGMLGRIVGEDIHLVTESDPRAGSVLADPGGIHQVLMNLLVNARDAMPDGGKVIIRCHRVDFDRTDADAIPHATPGTQVVLEVTDEGHGMSGEVRKHIFEPFFTTKPEGKGTGLGLPMVYGIVRQAGGWIQVQSQPGLGTTFRVGFPALIEPAAGGLPPRKRRERLEGLETILVVEDQEEVRKFTLAALKSFHYRTLEARTGADAIRIAEQHDGPIHLLLTDVIMPGMTGRQVAGTIAQLRPEIKILYMSGYTADVLFRQGVDESRAACLVKPFTADELARQLRAALGERQAAARVLVVDDDAAIREYFASVLEGAGFAVAMAPGGEDAQQMMQSDPFDLAIVDLIMPGQGGVETISALRRIRPDVRILAASGAFGGPVPHDAALIGADAIISKPVKPGQLLQTVRLTLG